MQSKVMSMVGFVLCVFLMVACGDSNTTPGFGGGGLVCASDDPEVGDTIDCPSGEKTIDFCIDTGNGSRYYVVDGEQIGCGNCFDGGNNLFNCAQQAVDRCQ
jgi:hypothetical protein